MHIAERQSPCPLWVISGHRSPNCDVRFTPESGHRRVGSHVR